MVRRIGRSDVDAVDEVNVLQAEREPGFSPSYAIYKGNGESPSSAVATESCQNVQRELELSGA